VTVRSRLVLAVVMTLSAVALATSAAACGPARASNPISNAPGHLADSTIVGCPALSTVVPADYTGISVEWSMVQHWFGTSRETINAAMVNVLKSLELDPWTPGVIRIGGESEDGYRWERNGSTTRNGLFTGVINAGLVDAVFEVARRTGWKVIVGLNLRSNDPRMALHLARYVVQHDTGGNLSAFEIGNEPSYLTEAAYLARYRTYADLLASDRVTSRAPITGPATSQNQNVGWARDLWPAYRPTGRKPYATWHYYANSSSLDRLLQTSTITKFNARISAMDAAVGRGHHRVGEGNDHGQGGLAGVSNVTGKAAWLIDTLLDGAARGLSGYDNHSWDEYYYPKQHLAAWYTPFVVRAGQASPRPGFYALALFKYALGKRFCDVSTSNAAGQLVRSWAVTDPAAHRLYAYVINKGGTGKAGTVGVTAPAGHRGTGYLNVMTDAAGCYGKTTAIQGAKLGGSGAYSWSGTAIRPMPGTTQYEFRLGECSTALLSIP
jgi:hypothetical protein